MARLFVTSIDLNKNELKNARIQNLGSAPSSPVLGQIYYNSSDNKMYYYNGLASPNGPWVTMSGSDEVIQDVLAAAIVAGTGLTKTYDDLAGTLTLAIDDTVVTKTDTQTLTNKTLEDTVLKDRVSFTNNSDVETMYVEHSYTGTNRIVSQDDLALRPNDGDIILYPGNDNGGTGKAYVHWGNDATGAAPENEITTAGNIQNFTNKTVIDSLHFKDGINNYSAIHPTADRLDIDGSNGIQLQTNTGAIDLNPDTTANVNGDEIVTRTAAQVITNKTVNDELYFTNPSTMPNDGGIKVNDITEDLEIRAYTADLELYSNLGDINLNPDGVTNVDSQLNVSGNLNVGTVAGSTANSADGSLTAQDGNGNSQIHINGTTHDIELLPHSGSKAFYGSAATAGNEIAKLSDLQALSSGLNWKTAVNLLSTSDLLLSADFVGAEIDGHPALTTADAGYRILIIGQDNSSENGIYELVLDNGSLIAQRSSDADANDELIGAAVFVMEGTQYGSTSWVQSNHYVTAFANQDWIQFSGQGTYIGSDSIQIDGRQVNVILDSDSLEITGDGLKVNYHTDSGLDNDSGLYVKLGTGLVFDGSGNITNNTSAGYGVRKFTTLLGNEIATSFGVAHNFGTRHITAQVFETSAPYALVETDVERTDLNTVTIKFASAPGIGEYEVVIVG